MSIGNNTTFVAAIYFDIKYGMYPDQSEFSQYLASYEFASVNEYVIVTKLFMFQFI